MNISKAFFIAVFAFAFGMVMLTKKVNEHQSKLGYVEVQDQLTDPEPVQKLTLLEP